MPLVTADRGRAALQSGELSWTAGQLTGDHEPMAGVVVIVAVLLVAIPVGVLVSGAVAAGLLGWSLKTEGEAANEGSELIPLNK